MRIDSFLVENGFFESRQKAKVAINEGRIKYGGVMVKKASFDADDKEKVLIIQNDSQEFVGRGGIKLQAALDAFSVNVAEFTAIDIGASTGGFTECLLKSGAKKVYAVDIGHGQLHKSLLSDARVVNLEGVNARELDISYVDGKKVDIAVSDLSFISQKLIIPAVPSVLCDGGLYIVLIKPQFEAGRENIGKGGIVKSEKVRRACRDSVIEFAKDFGFSLMGCIDSPILGGSGNAEYLACFKYNCMI